ncbi:Helicase associated domain protein [Streptomycetaceae bacterium NBC_01309]
MRHGIKLRPHQVEAVEAITAALGQAVTRQPRAGHGDPHAGLRSQAVSACGTGKTVIGSRVAARLAPRGRVLVVVPSLQLLTQTSTHWHSDGHRGTAIAVCSLEDQEELTRAGLRRATTTPAQLALWAAPLTTLTVYSTYTSLDVIEEAHYGPYGLAPLAPWDLVVVDEAHRTSGHIGKPWALVHDNTRIPAHRRLYLTATPRVWEAPGDQVPVRRTAPPAAVGHRDAPERTDGEALVQSPVVRSPAGDGGFTRLPERLAASMDDVAVFGKRDFDLPLSTAIDRGLLARYQIGVVEVRDREAWQAQRAADNAPEDARLVEAARGKRLAALQAALLKACAEYGLTTVLTFHHRTAEAHAFATTLPRVARRLHADAPDTYPSAVAAGWVYGKHTAEERREAIGRFAAGAGPTGERADLSVLANSKVVAEGVDIPAVDAVAFCDPKGSIVDIVQAVGRALRQTPQQGKLATLLVPVFLDPDTDESVGPVRLEADLDYVLEDELADDQDLDALHAADDEFDTDDESEEPDEFGQLEEGGGSAGGAAADARSAAARARTRRRNRERGARELFALSAYEPLAVVLQALRAHDSDVVDRLAAPQVSGTSPEQQFGLVYAEPEPETVGGPEAESPAREPAEDLAADLAVEPAAEEPWWANTPLLRFSTRRDPVEIAEFVRLRVIAPESTAWLRGLAAAKQFHARDGHLRVPLDHWEGPFPLGQWLSEQRRIYFASGLDYRRVAALDSYGMVWRVPDAQFAENLAMCRAYHRTHGHLAAPNNAVIDGHLVGQFLKNCRRPGAFDKHPERRAELDAIDPWWNPPWPIDWQRNYNRLRGHLTSGPQTGGGEPAESAGLPPRQPVHAARPSRARTARFDVAAFELTVSGEDLGAWLRRQIERWPDLHKSQRRLLTDLGITRPRARKRRASGTPAAEQPSTAPEFPPAHADSTAQHDTTTASPHAAQPGEPQPQSRSQAEKFTVALTAAAQFRAREGHLNVPRKHTETLTDGPYAGEAVALGVWIANQRARAAALTDERRNALTDLGMRW